MNRVEEARVVEKVIRDFSPVPCSERRVKRQVPGSVDVHRAIDYLLRVGRVKRRMVADGRHFYKHTDDCE